jgi:peptide/nickel transport system substrate-binding protein
MIPRFGLALLAMSLGGLAAGAVVQGALAQPAAPPQGELTYAMHVTVAPAWFDPADNTGIATPFMVQEALHDALVKPSAWQPR